MIEQLSAPARAVGGFVEMSLDTLVKIWRRPFQFREFIEQTWVIARVSLIPTLLVAIPFTVLVSFTLNILLRELGAADLSGAGTAFGTITQLGPVVTVLVVAGAGATAICADLSRRAGGLLPRIDGEGWAQGRGGRRQRDRRLRIHRAVRDQRDHDGHRGSGPGELSYDTTLRIRRFFRGVPRAVDVVGEQALFYGESVRYIPNALTRYRKETIRLIAEMTMGAGALVMIGGTVGVAAFLTLASGGR